MRLVDADLLKEQMESVCMGIMAGTDSYDAPLKTIDDAPTIDPVKHGKWVYEQHFRWGGYRCSECGTLRQNKKGMNYCQNCGARMEAEDETN